MNPYQPQQGAIPPSNAAINYPRNADNPSSANPGNRVLSPGEVHQGPSPHPHASQPHDESPGPSSGGHPGGFPGSASASKHAKLNPAHLFCQVEDCRAPLEGLKEYHQRYKVCDHHLKMEYIERDGQKYRFCQQCGRFQPLDEFDDRKRSCRARLQRHNARRRKRPRELDDLADPTSVAAIAAGFTPSEVNAMQDAMQFASATLMQTTAQGSMGGIQPTGIDVAAAAASATIAGLPFGGGLTSMPFVPSRQVMILLLKGYAGMFHYNIESIHLKPRAEPTPIHDLTAPMEAAAAAAAAAMGVAGVAGGHHPTGGDSAAAHLMAIQTQQGAAGEYNEAAAAAAAAAAAGLAMDLSGVAAGLFPGGTGGVFSTDIGAIVGGGSGGGQGAGHHQHQQQQQPQQQDPRAGSRVLESGIGQEIENPAQGQHQHHQGNNNPGGSGQPPRQEHQ